MAVQDIRLLNKPGIIIGFNLLAAPRLSILDGLRKIRCSVPATVSY